ncbi:MAG: UbiA family prenyltransferase [Candidatus Micrarchaeota archaeon]
MGFLRELFRLTRFEHALMLAFGVFIAEAIVYGGLPPLEYYVFFSLLVPIFSEMGSFALNDYFDIETDRRNKKIDRPLVRGTIPPRFALWFSVSCFVLSVLSAIPINATALAIAVVFNLLAAAYNWKLKDFPLIGNSYIALTMAIPFIFGNFVVSETLSPIALALAAMGFVAGLAREIVKSVQDMEGDMLARGSKTLPVIIGKRPAEVLASLLYLAFVPLSFSPFFLGMPFTAIALALIGAGDALILLGVFGVLAKGDYKKARNYSLYAFMLGMAGFLVAIL